MTQSKKTTLPHIVKITTESFESAISNQIKSCQDFGIYSPVSHTLSQWALKAIAAAVPESAQAL